MVLNTAHSLRGPQNVAHTYRALLGGLIFVIALLLALITLPHDSLRQSRKCRAESPVQIELFPRHSMPGVLVDRTAHSELLRIVNSWRHPTTACRNIRHTPFGTGNSFFDAWNDVAIAALRLSFTKQPSEAQ